MTDIREKMKADAKKAEIMAKEVAATLKYYAQMAWKAIKNPLMGLSAAAILSSCGIVGNHEREVLENADIEKMDKTVQVAKEKQQKDDIKKNPYVFGYSNPNEVVETPEEREMREAEEEFERIRGGEYTHGDAGTDKADYGKPGDRGPGYTKEDLDKIREIYGQVGRGADNVDLGEIDKEIGRNSDNYDSDDSRDISWIKAIRDSGRGR